MTLPGKCNVRAESEGCSAHAWRVWDASMRTSNRDCCVVAICVLQAALLFVVGCLLAVHA